MLDDLINLILISTIVACHFDKLHSSILKSCKCLDVIFWKLNSLLLNFGNYSRGQKNRTIFFR
jgi:hypothetical protein